MTLNRGDVLNLTDTQEKRSKYTIKLSRGYTINLTELIENLNHLTVEIGWDQMEPAKVKGFFSWLRRFARRHGKDTPPDLDTFMLLLDHGTFGKAVEGADDWRDLIFFLNNERTHNGKAVVSQLDDSAVQKDGKTGIKEGFDVYLNELPDYVDEVVVGINLWHGKERKQDLRDVHNAYVRIKNGETGAEAFEFRIEQLTGSSGTYSFIFGKFRKNVTDWEFEALGNDLVAPSVMDVARRYMWI